MAPVNEVSERLGHLIPVQSRLGRRQQQLSNMMKCSVKIYAYSSKKIRKRDGKNSFR